MWRRPKAEIVHDPGEPELVEECRLFLSGTYRAYLEARGQELPAWVWINQLAHGSQADIECAAGLAGAANTPAALVGEIAAAMLKV